MKSVLYAGRIVYLTPEEFSQLLDYRDGKPGEWIRQHPPGKGIQLLRLGFVVEVTSGHFVWMLITGEGENFLRHIETVGWIDGDRMEMKPPATDEMKALLDKSIGDLNLSVRAWKCMDRLAIKTLGQLVQCTADDLLEQNNFGTTSLHEIVDKLDQHGLSLRDWDGWKWVYG